MQETVERIQNSKISDKTIEPPEKAIYQLL